MIAKVNTKQVQDSINVWNNRNILKYYMDIGVKSFEVHKKCLAAVAIKELGTAFGKCNKAMRLEYYTRVWVLEFRGLTFNVFTANNKGTTVEICNKTWDEVRALNTPLEKDIKDFLDQYWYQVL